MTFRLKHFGSKISSTKKHSSWIKAFNSSGNVNRWFSPDCFGRMLVLKQVTCEELYRSQMSEIQLLENRCNWACSSQRCFDRIVDSKSFPRLGIIAKKVRLGHRRFSLGQIQNWVMVYFLSLENLLPVEAIRRNPMWKYWTTSHLKFLLPALSAIINSHYSNFTTVKECC